MRILVVDDDVRLAATVRRGLEAEGFAVDVAHDGVDGRHLASEHDYGAIVLDVMLPGINGFKLCHQIRQDGDWTPILMLTAKDGDLDEAEALDTGADDFLSKPFSFVVLVARLRALLRRGARQAPVAMAAGDLLLDPAAHRCTRAGRDVTLTAREFAVLELLVRRRGQVVSKADVLGNVWDAAFDGDPNIVEVYVRRLRRKIDEPFGRRAIETVRGAGYRLDDDGG